MKTSHAHPLIFLRRLAASALMPSLLGLASAAALAGAPRLDDGILGATCEYFNRGAVVKWNHRAGDWIDAQRKPRGPDAFASAFVKDIDKTQTVDFDVTGLATGLQAAGASELQLLIRPLAGRPAGKIVFHSRESGNPAREPVLLLTYESGKKTSVAPSADSTIDCTTVQSLGREKTIAAGGEQNLLLQFDLPARSGTEKITRAVVTLVSERQYGDSHLGVFQLALASAAKQTPQPGFAAAYPRDEGIGADPNVVMATGFDALLWGRAWSYGATAPTVDVVSEDRTLGFEPLAGKALRVKIPKGEHTGLNMAYKFREKTGAEPDEIYFRYYLRFANDWNPTVEGGKLPGISGTYGEAGWGGRKTDGTNGWSVRGAFWKTPPVGNPSHGLTPVGTYAYHAELEDYWGDAWPWTRDLLGVLARNRWYCLEQYVKLNTPGRKDGIMRAWVDGMLAFEKTDINFRKVPTLKVEMIWMNVYHGGGAASPYDQHLYIDNVVIAKKYIGPMKR